jgi:hypothetical protein
METYVCLWPYFPQFFSERERFRRCLYWKFKHNFCSITLSWPSCCLLENVERYFWVGQATDDNIIWNTLCAYRVTKATNTNSDYVTLNDFPWQKWQRERCLIWRLYVHSCLVTVKCNPIRVLIYVFTVDPYIVRKNTNFSKLYIEDGKTITSSCSSSLIIFLQFYWQVTILIILPILLFVLLWL